MKGWQSILGFDPLEPLLCADSVPVRYFAQRDLAGQEVGSVEALWELPGAKRIVAKQQADGSWRYPGGNARVRSQENYDQIETFRNLGFLVEMYGLTRAHPAVSRAAEFLWQFQTNEGDIRGILGNQYSPYYTAAMVELLVKAGYQDDERVEKVFHWLDGMRQDDSGWAIPLRTQGKKLDVISMEAETLEPDRSRPSSHMVTGIVLRAYAAHESYRRSKVAREAGGLLADSLFKRDHYADRADPAYWVRFTFPFWFTDLISAMDTLSWLGFPREDARIQRAVEWFAEYQQADGLWKLKVLKNLHYDNDLWLSLAICRILKRLVL